jgi:hypothetical protein
MPSSLYRMVLISAAPSIVSWAAPLITGVLPTVTNPGVFIRVSDVSSPPTPLGTRSHRRPANNHARKKKTRWFRGVSVSCDDRSLMPNKKDAAGVMGGRSSEMTLPRRQVVPSQPIPLGQGPKHR